MEPLTAPWQDEQYKQWRNQLVREAIRLKQKHPSSSKRIHKFYRPLIGWLHLSQRRIDSMWLLEKWLCMSELQRSIMFPEISIYMSSLEEHWCWRLYASGSQR